MTLTQNINGNIIQKIQSKWGVKRRVRRYEYCHGVMKTG